MKKIISDDEYEVFAFKKYDEITVFEYDNLKNTANCVHMSKLSDATILLEPRDRIINLTPLKYNIGPFTLYSLIKMVWKETYMISNPFPIMMIGIEPSSGKILYEMLSGWRIVDPNSKLIEPIYKLPKGINYGDL